MDQRLIVFKEVVERKSFSKTAEALHMSQPAVSQYIASLEKEFGVRLLERSNKFVHLNHAGRIVYSHAQEILRSYERMHILVSDLKNEPAGELKIGASYTIGEYMVPGILGTLKQEYPNILPDVMIANTSRIARRLLNQEIDIGLIEGEYSHPQLTEEAFATDQMYIIAASGESLVKEKRLSPADLENETWIIREEGSGTREMAEAFFQKHQIKPQNLLTFGSTQLIKEAVEAGLGISMLSELTIKKELQLQTLKKLAVQGTPTQRTFSIIRNNHEFQPRSQIVFGQVVQASVV
ncbi:LysR family transcriptional regulator [Lentibacillus sediminis]|uniref:LysR family transcriptional regulator n=1 Tax=Lentibacillus sediminis TaxID=1940529 RepID=UPI000C1B944B|nr:LysR family transcriptional regulator [Lentibacillus sediminis]